MGLVLGTLFYQDTSFQEMVGSVYSSNISFLEGKKADLMVPVFIIHYLPSGIIGILIVAIMSAAMSSLSSTINSLSAVTMEDFVKRYDKDISDKKYINLSRIISVFWGLLCLFIALFTGKIEGTVIEVINRLSKKQNTIFPKDNNSRLWNARAWRFETNSSYSNSPSRMILAIGLEQSLT